MSFAEDVLNSFAKFGIDGKMACACSGGADSLAMTLIAARKFDVVALVVDHGLRIESAGEATATAAILERLGIAHVVLKNKVAVHSNVQENARNLRYQLMTGYCLRNGINWLATGHHADDNAETFLLRLSRGSGVDGLSGIAELVVMNKVKVIRPVLGFTKLELVGFLESEGVEWVEDPTNGKDIYKRNKLRLGLDGLEDKELITRRINDAAVNLARVRGFLESEVERAYQSCIRQNPHPTLPLERGRTKVGVSRNDEIVVIGVEKFRILHDEIAYRVLVKIIMELSGAIKKPRFEKLKRLKDDLLEGKKRTLNGLMFTSKNNQIMISIEK